METQTGNSECGYSQQRSFTAQAMSLPDTCHSVCRCGSCSAFYSLTAVSPAMSACSSIQDDMSPCTVWSKNTNTQPSEMHQPAFDASCFGAPQALGMPASPDCQSCLDGGDPACYSFGMPIGHVDESIDLATSSSCSSEGPFAAFEPISTIASRNEVCFTCSRSSRVELY